VAGVEINAEWIIATLRAAGVGYIAEGYGVGGELLREWAWEAA